MDIRERKNIGFNLATFTSKIHLVTRIDVQTRMYIVGIYAVLDNELSEFEIFTPSVFFGQLRQ